MAGLAIAAFSGHAIVGWHAGGPPPEIPLGLEHLQYDTAWAFAAIGAALVAAALHLIVLTRLLAAVPIALGGLRVLAFAVQGSVPVRPILANPWLPFGAGAYNEMGLLTALLLLALGVALTALRTTARGPVRSVFVTAIAASALAIALLLLFGAWTGGASAGQWLMLTGGDRTNAVLAIAVSLVLLVHASLGSPEERRILWRWTPAIVWFAVFVCALVLWRSLSLQEAQAIRNSTWLVAADIRGRIERNLADQVTLLGRLAARTPTYASSPQQWQRDASLLLPEGEGLTALGWIDSGFVLQGIAPAADLPASGAEIRNDPQLGPAVAAAASTRRAALTRVFDVARGGNTFAIVVPSFDGDALRGLVVAEVPGSAWFASLFEGRFHDYQIDLDQGGRQVGSVASDGADAGPDWQVEQSVELAGTAWQLRVTPTASTVRNRTSRLPEVALALGVLLASLLALCTRLFQTARLRAHDLAATNARLIADIAARTRAEQALRDSERRTRLIINAIKDCAIYMLEPDGRIGSWNPGAAGLTGYPESEALDRHHSMLFAPDPARAPAQVLEAALRDGAAEEQRWHQRRDGTRFFGDTIVSAIRDDDGAVQGFSVVTRDVTQQLEMQQQTERSRDFYFALFSDLPNLVWRSDSSGGCDYVNNAWVDYTGKAGKSQLGDGWLGSVHPDDRARWQDLYRRSHEARQPFELEARLARADGTYGSFICTARPYHEMQGRFAGFICSCYDITARRVTESALKESEARYEGMTSNVPGTVFRLVRDVDDVISFAYVSAGCEPLTGVTPAKLRADPEAFFALIPAAHRPHLEATLDASAAQLANWMWSGPLRPLHEANEKWVSVRARPRRLDDGGIVWDGLVLDDTPYRLAQLEVERSREELRSLSRHTSSVREQEKASVAREVHDELGSTLTALRIDLGLLADRLPAAFPDLREKCAAMGHLVDAAVAATRKIVSDLRPGMLDDLGLAAALAWQAGEYAKHTPLKITVDAPESDGEMDRECALTLFRIFQEALTNVARHAEATEVRVTLSESGTGRVLTVHDNGRGLAGDALAKPASHGIRGMRERARELGGDLSVQSKPGAGTMLVVTIPKANP